MSTSNMTDSWSLVGGGVTVFAREAGVTEIVRRRATSSVETCILRREGTAFDAAPLFAFGSTVTVTRAGVPWFVGRVTVAPGTGDGRAEASELWLSGPWWYLEQLVCQQQWTVAGGADTAWSSRLIVGQALDGTRLSSREVILETLQFAIDAGAPWQIGIVEPDAVLPLDELRDVTCAEVIRKVLRWHPDCVAWFDHTTTPVPTFHCRARGSLAAVTLTFGQAPLAEVQDITARPDLLTPAVVLHYETNDGDMAHVLTDIAPEGATGQEFGALVVTIPAELADPSSDGGVEIGGGGFVSVDDLPTRGSTRAVTLAQALYAARAGLTYSGSVVLAEAEAGATAVGVGSALNLAGGGRVEWATMGAAVVEDETWVARGKTRLRFGPVGALGGAGLAAALKVTRPGVDGREAGSPGAARTGKSGERLSGRVAVGG